MGYLYGKQKYDLFCETQEGSIWKLKKVVMVRGISHADYKEFRHILAFDMTYKCNTYNKPFVDLVGVNHHQNTVPFGCALVVNEKEGTYVWVLQQLIEVGDGYIPLIVITDRDKAMENAIFEVLRGTKHRLRIWHPIRNVQSNAQHSFHDGFFRCAEKCRTPSDFERDWK
ncbi:protein FAR1-RELATED SEQUENCE 5-like [Hibiscus syriacus]|uniref:protein FAR1-RELATED SEQUENCE 5-like n=1 Tax=Hibiscus syriacus TaxID=106335 RepID=UPI001921FBCB|nr:protein FAR1-RELATED SEQUENCE 5-like [Hibiscus syriacus]